MQSNQGDEIFQDYAEWKRRADLLHKAQRAMQDARDAVGALDAEPYKPSGMVRPLMVCRDRQDEAGMWLMLATEEH
jgi:hypothetical protein